MDEENVSKGWMKKMYEQWKNYFLLPKAVQLLPIHGKSQLSWAHDDEHLVQDQRVERKREREESKKVLNE